MDVAASEFQTSDKMYDLKFKEKNNDGSGKKTGAEMLEMYKGFIEHYGVITIEDPYEQDDWGNWKDITEACGVGGWLAGCARAGGGGDGG
jgi:enolase